MKFVREDTGEDVSFMEACSVMAKQDNNAPLLTWVRMKAIEGVDKEKVHFFQLAMLLYAETTDLGYTTLAQAVSEFESGKYTAKYEAKRAQRAAAKGSAGVPEQAEEAVQQL